jgi:hypothetical protein
MQTGDRLSYHPERCPAEIAHLHDVLPKAQAAVAAVGAELAQRQATGNRQPANPDAQGQRRLDAAARAEEQVNEAGK